MSHLSCLAPASPDDPASLLVAGPHQWRITKHEIASDLSTHVRQFTCARCGVTFTDSSPVTFHEVEWVYPKLNPPWQSPPHRIRRIISV